MKSPGLTGRRSQPPLTFWQGNAAFEIVRPEEFCWQQVMSSVSIRA